MPRSRPASRPNRCGRVAAGHHREIFRRQGLKREARAAAAQLQPVVFLAELNLGAVGELADDVVKRVRRRRRRPFGADGGGHRLDDRDIHVGRGKAQLRPLGLDQHIRQDGDRVAPLDDALHVVQGAKKFCAFDCKLHGSLSIRFFRERRCPLQNFQVAERVRGLSLFAAPPPTVHDRLVRLNSAPCRCEAPFIDSDQRSEEGCGKQPSKERSKYTTKPLNAQKFARAQRTAARSGKPGADTGITR